MLIPAKKIEDEFANKFAKCKDFTKFIDEYIELLKYIENKYPSFKVDINKDYWISRIIKEHYEILLSLSDFLPEDEKICFNEYIHRMERKPFIEHLCSK